MKAGSALLLIALLAMLAVTLWWAHAIWIAAEGAPMTGHHVIAMVLGIVFSLVVGCGLMALVFYSHRKGYDEPPRVEPAEDTDRDA